MTTRPLLDHRVTGTERKLRSGHGSTKHRTIPSSRYDEVTQSFRGDDVAGEDRKWAAAVSIFWTTGRTRGCACCGSTCSAWSI